MATCMKAMKIQGAERSNVVGDRRSTCRVITSIEQKTDTSNKKLPLIKEYQEQVKSELRSVCSTILELLDKYLIANASNPDSKVFYLKMKGAYFWYLAGLELHTLNEDSYKDNTLTCNSLETTLWNRHQTVQEKNLMQQRGHPVRQSPSLRENLSPHGFLLTRKPIQEYRINYL